MPSWQDLNVNSLDHAKILRRRFARALLTSPRAAVPATDPWLISGSLLYRLTDERRPTNRDEISVTMADGSRESVAREARARQLLALLDAAPAAPVDEYDGNHVQNHCTECNEHEAECSCAQAVAAPVAEIPEGCTPADAKMLRAANHELAAENDRLRHALGPFARLVSTDRLSWAMVEYQIKDDPEKQTFRHPHMQRAFNRVADLLSEDLCCVCEDLEAECNCGAAQAVAADRAQLTDSEILAKAKDRVYSRPFAEVEYYDFNEKELISFARDLLGGRAAVSPATSDERAARLDDADIDAIAESMPGGLGSFMKQWGWRQFARAVEDEVVLNVARASQGAAPAEAREPDAYMTLDCVSLKPASVYLNREDVADMRPDHVVPLYRGGAPADAGEAVGVADSMPGTSGFTMACFEAAKVPIGTKLYAAANAGEAVSSFIRDVASQKPVWGSSCGQCESNRNRAQDLLKAAQVAQGGKEAKRESPYPQEAFETRRAAA
ncbi:hypothetical protein [Burkholderia glumae]|uniref:hypothetical protein n=1 Tax=Burkholderia glumae TaxID=337 RepID=UPI00131F4FAA|nr:hypothetical protein [Burkholderia glumae]QHE11827.1 hypothetical protein GQR88_16400 [Burkholderia glumae AU6208]